MNFQMKMVPYSIEIPHVNVYTIVKHDNWYKVLKQRQLATILNYTRNSL